jgi:carboxyl-terminal processing protease
MVPDDPTTPSPGSASTAGEPGAEAIAGSETIAGTEAAEGAEAASGAEPGPGYIGVDVPVVVASRPSRRGSILGTALVVVAILGGAALFVSGYSLGREQGLAPGASSGDASIKAFWDTFNAVHDRFALATPTTQQLVEGAIKGMVAQIGDPYSTYLTPEDYQASLQDISGEFEGIGVTVGSVDASGKTSDCTTFGPNCRFAVIAPLDGSPAQAAGIQAGDIFTAVDGKTLDGVTADQARNLIRGPAGTTVTVTVQRGTAAPFDVTITRAKITRQEVVAKALGNGTVGYVQLSGFSDAGADAFVAAVKADVDKGIKKLVIDLRGNPGGFINDAQKVASVFIASGPVFYEQFADCHQQEWDALGGAVAVATDPSIKVMLLVDGGSASAAEIVTGALKDTGRATIVGAQTFGKGTVQEWITLDQLGAVKLTIAKWLTPDKDWIHKIGFTPDVPVATPANTPPGSDPVLDKALALLGAPVAGPSASPATPSTPEPTVPPATLAPGASATPADTQPPDDCKVGLSSPSIAPASPGASTLWGSWLLGA